MVRPAKTASGDGHRHDENNARRQGTWRGRIANLPKPWRLVVGGGLVVGGLLGFLPVLGFWMLPLGLVVLSRDSERLRRWRRRMTVKWYRR